MACRLFGTKLLSIITAGLLSIRPAVTNFNDILIEMQNIEFIEMYPKISPVKW